MTFKEDDSHQTQKKKFPFGAILKIFLAIVGILLIISPFLPAIQRQYYQSVDRTKGYKYASKLAINERQNVKLKLKDLKPIPKENTLVIPKIGVDAKLQEGKGVETLNKGIWRRPNGSIPPKGGNTVLAGHRYLYTSGPNTFYSLDKIAIGDEIIIFWEGKEYDYQVFNTREVLPTAVEIENNTKEPIVTLYTCAPLFSSKYRLVVTARLITE